jgi:hypothetical protein
MKVEQGIGHYIGSDLQNILSILMVLKDREELTIEILVAIRGAISNVGNIQRTGAFFDDHYLHHPEMPELSHEQEIEVGMAYAKREVDFELSGDMAEQFNDTQPGDE